MLHAGDPILIGLAMAVAWAGDVVVVPVGADASARATETMVAEELALALGQAVPRAEPDAQAAAVWVLPRPERVDAVVVTGDHVVRFSVAAGELAPAEIAARAADVITAPVVAPPVAEPADEARVRLEVGLDVGSAFGAAGYLGPAWQPGLRGGLAVRHRGWAAGMELGARTGRQDTLRTTAVEVMAVGGWRASFGGLEVGPHLTVGVAPLRVELARDDDGVDLVRYTQLRAGGGLDLGLRLREAWVVGLSIRAVGLPIRDRTSRAGEPVAHDTGRLELGPTLSIRWRR